MSWHVEVGGAHRDGERSRCDVRVNGQRHEVTVSDADLAALAPGGDAVSLIRASFEFLLEREPPGSILQRFDVSVIEQYFPGYRAEISGRLRR
jgi:hypothetical protein